MATMTSDNGTKTSEQMAKDIVESAFENKNVSISGTTFQRLEKITSYFNRNKIAARSESWFKKNLDSLVSEALYDIIDTRHKQLVKQLALQENNDRRKAFVELLAKGVAFKDAVSKTGYNPDLDTEK